MKKQLLYLIFPVLALLVTGCFQLIDFSPPKLESAYEPILMSRKQLETSVVKKEAQPIIKPGKLYHYGHYILINEQFAGVHLINNQNPRSPQNIGFIQVPGSVDFAVKNNVLYLDNAVDLVAVDLSNLNAVQVTKRVKNALPELVAPDNLSYELKDAPADAVIVGWKLKEKK